MEPHGGLSTQLLRHHAISVLAELCHGGAFGQAWTDVRRTTQRHFRQCGRADCQSYLLHLVETQPANEEIQVSVVALKNGEIRIVQSSMLGSILSNMLLVLGCCFLAGGIRFHQQKFNETVASTMSSLMAVASASLIIPSTLYAVMSGSSGKTEKDDNILILSHGTAIILLILYVLYLIFQLKTHTDLFDEQQGSDEGDLQEAQTLTPVAAGLALVVITVAVAVCAEYLVDSIDSLVETAHISKTFIGLILIPIVGNAAEHVTAVVVSYKDKMDLAIGVAIGSSKVTTRRPIVRSLS